MVEYVIAHCTVTPVRQEPSEGSEQLTQLLFGEVCEVLDRLPRWTKIRSTLDGQEGWVDFKMVSPASSLIASSPHRLEAVVAVPMAAATPMDGGADLLLTLGTRLSNYAHGTFEVLGKQYLIDPACVSQPISNSPSGRPIGGTPSNSPIGASDDCQLPAIICTDFVSQMPLAYALADLVISRAGASSISELCLLGKPSILVPSPNVAEDHQTHNAMALVKKDAAVLVKDADAKDALIATALPLIKDDKQLAALHKNILTLALPDSARLIADEVMKLASK